MRWQKLYNPVVIRLLRSPVHGLLGGSVVLITYTGRKSGKTYTVPVNYVRSGDDLLVVASRDHVWWRSLRDGGVPVGVRVHGRDVEATASALEGAAAEEGLITVLRQVPAYRRYWRVVLDERGEPEDPADLARISAENVLVRIEVSAPGRPA